MSVLCSINNYSNTQAKIDAENKELYLLGDFNCNLLPEANAYNSSYLTNIFDIYGLSQLITEPTRVTLTSKTSNFKNINRFMYNKFPREGY